MVLDRKQIIRNYMRKWFWLDFLAFFPFDVPFLIASAAGAITDDNFPTGVFGMLKVSPIPHVPRARVESSTETSRARYRDLAEVSHACDCCCASCRAFSA